MTRTFRVLVFAVCIPGCAMVAGACATGATGPFDETSGGGAEAQSNRTGGAGVASESRGGAGGDGRRGASDEGNGGARAAVGNGGMQAGGGNGGARTAGGNGGMQAGGGNGGARTAGGNGGMQAGGGNGGARTAGGNGGMQAGGGASGTHASGGAAGAAGQRAGGGGQSDGGAAGLGTAAGGRSLVDGSTGASADAGAVCKRGLAANTVPNAAFAPAVAWWYNWATRGSGQGPGIEFVPMAWGTGSLGSAIPDGSRFLLGFNEPNFHAQSNLTPQQAASAWPEVEARARLTGAAIVSPGMNFCGPADQCNGTDPYKYLKDFFAACSNCKVDYVAVHWYNCDLPSLRDYLEPGGNLEGLEQFGKPIWLTEFSCPPSASVSDQEAYMRAAIPYLENNPRVFRYSWFSADPIPNARLIGADGSPTALGRVYMTLPQSCR